MPWSRKKVSAAEVKEALASVPPPREPVEHEVWVADWLVSFHGNHSEQKVVAGWLETAERDNWDGSAQERNLRLKDYRQDVGTVYVVAYFDRNAVRSIVSTNWRIESRGSW